MNIFMINSKIIKPLNQELIFTYIIFIISYINYKNYHNNH